MENNFKIWQSKYPDSWFSCIPGKNGFLPVGSPLDKLPQEYDIINNILEDMKLKNNGYLKNATLKNVIDRLLPVFDLSHITDKQLLAALHRDYCFLASAYSLETSHLELLKSSDNSYGIARDVLPEQLAKPLLVLGQKNDVFPWLDYAHGYGLNNAVLIDGSDHKLQQSYKTIRTFHGSDSEQGFINVHVAMVSQSGQLLKDQQDCLLHISNDNRDEFNTSLQKHFESFHSIVNTLQQMWKASSHNDYLDFRTFIMGQIGNKKCYPNEEIKYHLGDDNYETHAYRGETGAQDSIIPSVDSFLQLDYPENKLTEYLFNLRQYRPKDHQEYINFMKENSKLLKFKEYCLQDSKSSIILLKNLNCLRMFRKKHWNLTKKYIIQSTKHPVATGGTPITTWLPNQLGATLEYMNIIVKNLESNFESIDPSDLEFFNTNKVELSDHIQSIMDEVCSMQTEFNNQNYTDFLKK